MWVLSKNSGNKDGDEQINSCSIYELEDCGSHLIYMWGGYCGLKFLCLLPNSHVEASSVMVFRDEDFRR